MRYNFDTQKLIYFSENKNYVNIRLKTNEKML